MAKTGKIIITQGKQSIANNTSPITVEGIITTSGDSYRGGHRGGVLTVMQGSKVIHDDTFTHGAPANSTTTLFSITLTVTHDAEGKSEPITASYNYDDGWCTGTGFLALDTIPRKSELTVTNGTMGIDQILTIIEKASAFKHKLKYECGSASGWILGGSSSFSTENSVQWTPPISLAAQNTTGTSVSIKFTLYTYTTDGTLVGSTPYTKTFAIPASVKPTVTIDVSDNEGHADRYDGYVKGKSKVKVVLTAAGSQGSEIKSYKTTIDDKGYTDASFVTDYLRSYGTLTISATVTDSRGRTATATKTITVLDYAVPKLTSVSVVRCDSSGAVNATGGYLRVKFTSLVTALNNKNIAKYVVKYKKQMDTSYTSVTLTEYANSYAVSGGTYVFAADTGASYDVILTVEDVFQPAQTTRRGPTIRVFMSWFTNGLGIAFGKLAELAETFDVAWKAIFRKGITVYDDNDVAHDVVNELANLAAESPAYAGSNVFTTTGEGILNIPFSTLGISSRPKVVIAEPQNFKGLISYVFDSSSSQIVLQIYIMDEALYTLAPIGISSVIRLGLVVYA